MEKYTKYLMPTIYVGIIIIMILSVTLVVSGVKSYLQDKPDYDYTLDNVFESDIIPVVKSENNIIIRPYLNDNVKIDKYFYDYKSKDSKKQESSLIKYKNTYIQNKGVDYVCDESFDILAVLDGEVTSIEDNEIYGKVLTITHNENLKTIYSNISDILVSPGYKVSNGEIIAESNISYANNKKSLLHFEMYYKDKPIDPESVYTLSIDELE